MSGCVESLYIKALRLFPAPKWSIPFAFLSLIIERSESSPSVKMGPRKARSGGYTEEKADGNVEERVCNARQGCCGEAESPFI